MKIAMFHNLPKGGALRVFNEQKNFLSKKHKVDVYKANIKREGNRIKKDFDNFYLLKNIHKNLARKMDSKNYDVVIVHPDRHTQAPFLLQFLNTKSVYYCHEWLRIVYEKEFAFDNKSNILKYYYENLTRVYRKKIDYNNAVSADLVIANSRFTAKNIKKVYKKQTKYIYPGVDFKIFKPYKIRSTNQLIFVGDKTKENGYFLAKKIAEKSNLKLKIIHGNKLTDRQLAKEYSKSLATLCLAYNEPFGLVAIESLACHTPVLAVSEGGYKETVIDNKNGFLLHRDAGLFIKKLNTIKNNKFDYFDVSKFSWQNHNKKLEKFLYNLANVKS